MNGEDLPYLNGYPVRLIIPGTYSDSWIKMISNITVTKERQKLHFMDHAYRIADNDCECETPDNLAQKTKPIEEMNVNSIIGYPVSGTKVKNASDLVVRGVAFDGGYGIEKVQISTDGGTIWEDALLDDNSAEKYAYRTFTYTFKPKNSGLLTIMCRARNEKGEVLATAPTLNDGTYLFSDESGVNAHTNYRLVLSKDKNATVSTLVEGWNHADGENVNSLGKGNDGKADGMIDVSVKESDLKQVDFGINYLIQ
jgi:hypothetical protein